MPDAATPAGRKVTAVTTVEPREADGQLADLFRLHHAALVRLAVLLVHDQPTAEDAVQDVYLKLQTRRRVLHRDNEDLAYIRACVLNRCRSVLRHRKVVGRVGRLIDSFGDVPEDGDSPESQAIKAEERRQVLVALAGLPTRRREVLVLRYYSGLSEAEIARTLGISQGSVKSAAARGIAALAKALGEES
jgi:RNA polymerase sigma-70 factor (sigma-E family)